MPPGKRTRIGTPKIRALGRPMPTATGDSTPAAIWRWIAARIRAARPTALPRPSARSASTPYGELGPHHFVDQVNEYRLKSAATCTSPAVYYQSCSTCGAQGTETFTNGEPLGHDWGAWTSNEDGTHTRICKHDASHTETKNCHGGTATCTHKAVCTVCGGEYGEMAAHSFTAEKAEAQYLKSAATCTEKAIYYKSCAVCGLSSKGTADEATFFSGNALDHELGRLDAEQR